MICKLLKDIYINNIHLVLTKRELILSEELKQTFLDLLLNTTIKIMSHNNDKYYDYYHNDEKIFEVWIRDDNYKNFFVSSKIIVEPLKLKYNFSSNNICHFITYFNN